MKINPSNQTLILAADTRRLNGQPTAPSGAVLQRLTIVASQPDAGVLYVHADYANDDSRSAADDPVTRQIARSPVSARAAQVVSSGESFDDRPASRIAAAPSSSLKPAELYARTQGLLSETAQARIIDVRA